MRPETCLDAAGTALVIDTSADVPAALRPPSWRVIPIPISFGDERFSDGIDIDAPAFYARLARADRLPTTAQPSAPAVAEVLRDALSTHATAVVLPLSGRMSGTIESARTAAAEVGDDRVLVLESDTVCIALGLLALRVQAHLARGCTAGGLEAAVAGLRAGVRCAFSLETLEFLLRGGRIGRAQAVAGSLLRVRPILQIIDGEVAPAARVRGAHRVIPALREFVERNSDPARPLRVAYGHSDRPAIVPELQAMVAEARPRAITEYVGDVGPTVGAHAGPGAFAVAFVHDPLDEATA